MTIIEFNNPMNAVIQNPATIDQPVLEFFLSLWLRLKGARPMPSRSDIRMRDIREHVGSVVIVGVRQPDRDFTFKLIGSEVARYSFPFQTGKTVKEAYVGEYASFGERLLKIYTDIVDRRNPFLCAFGMSGGCGN